MRIKNSIGTESGDAIDKLSKTLSTLQAHKKSTSNTLTSFKSPRYVASAGPDRELGTSLSMRKGTRKMFIPAFWRVLILLRSGQV
jgi:hypothetical protein